MAKLLVKATHSELERDEQMVARVECDGSDEDCDMHILHSSIELN